MPRIARVKHAGVRRSRPKLDITPPPCESSLSNGAAANEQAEAEQAGAQKKQRRGFGHDGLGERPSANLLRAVECDERAGGGFKSAAVQHSDRNNGSRLRARWDPRVRVGREGKHWEFDTVQGDVAADANPARAGSDGVDGYCGVLAGAQAGQLHGGEQQDEAAGGVGGPKLEGAAVQSVAGAPGDGIAEIERKRVDDGACGCGLSAKQCNCGNCEY